MLAIVIAVAIVIGDIVASAIWILPSWCEPALLALLVIVTGVMIGMDPDRRPFREAFAIVAGAMAVIALAQILLMRGQSSWSTVDVFPSEGLLGVSIAVLAVIPGCLSGTIAVGVHQILRDRSRRRA
jgi:hypothetical protein